MLTRLRLQNFKSWADTGDIRLAPITCLFGANSSGKSSLIQSILLLKQTAAGSDTRTVLRYGDESTLVDLGDFRSLLYAHRKDRTLGLSLNWREPSRGGQDEGFDCEISAQELGGGVLQPQIRQMAHRVGDLSFGMQMSADDTNTYRIVGSNSLHRVPGRSEALPPPLKYYRFPDEVRVAYEDAGFLSELELHLAEALGHTYYLGPLRARPERIYWWKGDMPTDVGRSGELAIDALLSSRNLGAGIASESPGSVVEEYVAEALASLGLITSFALTSIASGSPYFEVKVQKNPGSAEVLLPDVGFGVSQILPVAALCAHVPYGSTIILEQPEIHLHPSAQSGLADLLINANKDRGIQIIVESHSEHLLRRLQRRIAEGTLREDETAIYFCENEGDRSRLTRLKVNEFGNISNWPTDFFGDQFGEMLSAEEARVKRQMEMRGA